MPFRTSSRASLMRPCPADGLALALGGDGMVAQPVLAAVGRKESTPDPVATSGKFQPPIAAGQVDTSAGQLAARAHAMGHEGVKGTLARLRDEGHTGGALEAAVVRVTRSCLVCARNNATPTVKQALTSYMEVQPGRHWAMDLCGELRSSQAGHRHVLVIADVATRMTYLEPLLDRRAPTVAAAFFRVAARVGFPDIVSLDNAPELRSELFTNVTSVWGVKLQFSSPYWSRGNGLAERTVRRMSESLRKSLDALPGDWAPRLSYTEYALNTSRVDGRRWTPLMAATMRATPSRAGRAGTEADLADEDVDALVAERLWLANELLLPALAAESAARAGARAEAWAKGKKITSPLEAGDLVVLDRPRLADGQEKLLRRFAGPYRVVRRNRGGSYVLSDRSGNELGGSFPSGRLRVVARKADDADAMLAEMEREADADDASYGFKGIKGHRQGAHGFEYLVQWRGGHGGEVHADSWVPALDFDDVGDLVRYHARIGHDAAPGAPMAAPGAESGVQPASPAPPAEPGRSRVAAVPGPAAAGRVGKRQRRQPRQLNL